MLISIALKVIIEAVTWKSFQRNPTNQGYFFNIFDLTIFCTLLLNYSRECTCMLQVKAGLGET